MKTFSHIAFIMLKWILSLVQLFLLLLAGFLLFIAISDFDPPPAQQLKVSEAEEAHQSADSSLTLITWNIGYGGLGKEMDFFYDGGQRVRPSLKAHKKYFQGITSFIKSHDSIDFFLLQEVDKNAKRSWRTSQTVAIRNKLPAHYSTFSKNYDVPFVPLPPLNPMGKVEAGMMTFSGIPPESAVRLALPDVYSWPKKHFMLDRAAIVTTHSLSTGKKLMVINIHNSAYVDDSTALQNELEVIRSYALNAYRNGFYVIIGGDWNQNPPAYSPEAPPHVALPWEINKNAFGEGWLWAYDTSAVTNRYLSAPLDDNTKRTTIDYFALSPNIKLKRIRVLPMNFRYSDHEPVYLNVTLTHH